MLLLAHISTTTFHIFVAKELHFNCGKQVILYQQKLLVPFCQLTTTRNRTSGKVMSLQSCIYTFISSVNPVGA